MTYFVGLLLLGGLVLVCGYWCFLGCLLGLALFGFLCLGVGLPDLCLRYSAVIYWYFGLSFFMIWWVCLMCCIVYLGDWFEMCCLSGELLLWVFAGLLLCGLVLLVCVLFVGFMFAGF